MKFGLPISFTFHVLFVMAGLLLWSRHVEQLPQSNIIPLKLVTVADITDVKPTRSEDDTPQPDEQSEKPVIPDVPLDQTIPDKTPITPVAEPVQPIPEPPSPDETDNKAVVSPPAFDLDALEKAFDNVRKNNPDADTQQTLTNENQKAAIADNSRMGAGAQTSDTVNALDYIRARLRDCWIVDMGAVDYQNLVVEVRLLLNRDGSIAEATVLNNAEIIASQNRAWPVARHNAMTALRKCAPYNGLLSIDYNVWKDLRLHLNPGEN
ncbi:MAG: hypothetical protein L3J65_10315 [Robiginitomaculum sp.]|nr:hypothetical protein [Robiginitomaculum sp.]